MKITITIAILGLSLLGFAQTANQTLPYSFEYYQKFQSEINNPEKKFHSSFKPFFSDDSIISKKYNQLNSLGLDSNKNTWVHRKIFNEHLLEVNRKDYTFYFDFLTDLQVGKASNSSIGGSTWLNTRGYQAGGTIGNKFTFYTSGYENQGKFPEYLNNYIDDNDVIPGQSYDRNANKNSIERDWSYSTAILSYTPVKYINLTLGQDKLFIGDGYRSMLLSDFATNYPFVKATANLGNIQYSAVWTGFQEQNLISKQFSYDAGNRKKGGVFHYLDWNVNNRLSVGFFDAIIWAAFDDDGNKRGFDFTYISPFIFLRPLEAMNGSPDNALIGFTSKYELSKSFVFYGQFSLDEFQAKEFFSNTGSNRNKWGSQLGIKGSDIFKINNLNYLLEYNVAKPYTYSSRNVLGTYAHYGEPLAHPFGANFKEYVALASYNYKRLNFFSKVNMGKYGYDTPGENYGKDLYKTYTKASKQDGNFIGQGLTTDLVFIENKISFLINPKTNLRFELGHIFRKETNSMNSSSTNWLNFGLRSSFRNLYYDF